MKHLRYFLMAALVALPLTACDEDSDPIVEDILYGTVSGTVSAEGTGLSGVGVTLVGATSMSATTGAGGTFTFTNVAAGAYGVSIDASTHPDVSFSQTAKTTTISTDGEVATVDFNGSYIRTASITGQVSAGGAPLAGVAVEVTSDEASIDAIQAVTDLGGAYQVTGLKAGSYTVDIDAPDGVNFPATSYPVTVGTGETKTVHFVGEAVQMATISGSVIIDNVGVAGVEVTLVTGGLQAGGPTVATTQTGLGGAYAFTNLDPGEYTVTITPPGDAEFDETSKSVMVGLGETGVATFAGKSPSEPATVSIQSITKMGAPIDLTNVFGQIEVTLNISRNDAELAYVDVLIGDVVVATQGFAAQASPAEMAGEEVVTLNVPTTQVMLAENGWTPAVNNGGQEVSALMYVVGGDQPVPTNKVPIVMQNYDAMLPGEDVGGNLELAVDEVSIHAVDADGDDWYTGPVYLTGPLFLAYATETPESVEFDAQCDVSANSLVGDYTTGIKVLNTFDCSNYEGIVDPEDDSDFSFNVEYETTVGPDGTAIVVNDEGFVAIGAEFFLSDGTVGPRRFIIEDPLDEQIDLPEGIPIDNKGPTVIMGPVAFNPLWDEWWINDEYVLTDAITIIDDGVGADPGSVAALEYLSRVWVEDPGEWVYTCGDPITNADLATTNTANFDEDAHVICGYGEDLLGNPPNNPNMASNPFGKDIVDPTVFIIGDGPGTDPVAACTAPYPLLAEGMNNDDNLFNMDLGNQFPVGIGFGVDASDNAAGFHQNDALQDGPVDQSLTRYFPALGDDSTNDLTVPGPQWLRYEAGSIYVRSSDFTAAEACMDGTVLDLTVAGLYVWEATVTDMAGNSVDLSQDWATDQVNPPTFSTMIKGPIPFFAGQPGLFQFFGSDDFEVGTVQVSMTYPTTAGDLELVYPDGAVDPAQSPWDMDYPFDRIQPFDYYAGLLNAGIVGRIDFTTPLGTTVPDFNLIDSDGDGANEDDDFLPTAVTGWIATDILGNGPSLDSGTSPFIGHDFGGWGNSTPAPWPAPDADPTLSIFQEWRLMDDPTTPIGDPADFVAQHIGPNSMVNPFFDAVVLVWNNAGVLTVCGVMSDLTQADQGFNRFYQYRLPTDYEFFAGCEDVTVGTWHAAGVVGTTDGAALLVTDAAVSLVVVPPPPPPPAE